MTERIRWWFTWQGPDLALVHVNEQRVGMSLTPNTTLEFLAAPDEEMQVYCFEDAFSTGELWRECRVDEMADRA